MLTREPSTVVMLSALTLGVLLLLLGALWPGLIEARLRRPPARRHAAQHLGPAWWRDPAHLHRPGAVAGALVAVAALGLVGSAILRAVTA